MVQSDERRGANIVFYNNQNKMRAAGWAFGVGSLVVAWFGHDFVWDTIDHYTDTPVREFLALWLGAIYVGSTLLGMYGISRHFGEPMDSAQSKGNALDQKEKRGRRR